MDRLAHINEMAVAAVLIAASRLFLALCLFAVVLQLLPGYVFKAALVALVSLGLAYWNRDES